MKRRGVHLKSDCPGKEVAAGTGTTTHLGDRCLTGHGAASLDQKPHPQGIPGDPGRHEAHPPLPWAGHQPLLSTLREGLPGRWRTQGRWVMARSLFNLVPPMLLSPALRLTLLYGHSEPHIEPNFPAGQSPFRGPGED